MNFIKEDYVCNTIYLEETLLGLELASQSYQWILLEESHTIGLLSVQIDNYERMIDFK